MSVHLRHLFSYVSKLYSFNHATMWEGRNCNNDFADGIVNGAKWYSVVGSMQDYNYLVSNAFDVTLELSCTKDVPASQLREEWKNNKEAMLKYMEATHSGVAGFVIDQDGEEVEGAKVSLFTPQRPMHESRLTTVSSLQTAIHHFQIHVEGIRKPVVTTKRGEYWRLLAPDSSYTLHVSKDGYKASDKKTITLPGNVWPPKFQIVEFKLEKET